MGPVKQYAYIEIYETIKEEIVNGDRNYNDHLPGKRELAKIYGVSVNTIEHALFLLEEEGYLKCVIRSGTFITYQKDSFFQSDVNNSSYIPVQQVYENTCFPYTPLASTMRKVLSNNKDILYCKQDHKGLLSFRMELMHYLKRSRNMSIDVEQIIIGTGAIDLYQRIVLMLGNTLTYGIEDPSYCKIKDTYTSNQITPVLFPLGKNGIPTSILNKQIVDVLHVTPYQSYPSRISTTISKRNEYIRYAKKHHAILIEDDYESEFSNVSKIEETLFSLSNDDNVIYLNSFSSTISPSIRVSYMILPKSLLEQYERTIGYISCGVSTYMQAVIQDLLSTGQFERHLNRVRRSKRTKNA